MLVACCTLVLSYIPYLQRYALTGSLFEQVFALPGFNSTSPCIFQGYPGSTADSVGEVHTGRACSCISQRLQAFLAA